MERNYRKKSKGTIGLENTLTQNPQKIKCDEAGKSVLKRKEVLAVILKYSLEEYKEYSYEEIINFIDPDSISIEESIAQDTDSRIVAGDPVQSSINEANLTFDVMFRICKPNTKKIHIHVDVELQGNYYPGYPLEKRAIYNLSRMISSQLDVVTKKTNYSRLEKAYCIFICVGNIPKYQQNTVSYCELVNTKNIGNVKIKKKNIDLMGLVMIRIGTEIDENVTDIIHFLHGMFYDIEEVKEYIDFSENDEFRKELKNMSDLGEHYIQLGAKRQKAAMQKEIADAKIRADDADKRADDADKRADDADRRADDADRRADDANKRADDADRRADDANNRITEEKEAGIRDLIASLQHLKIDRATAFEAVLIQKKLPHEIVANYFEKYWK